jgi:hypothetical protein
MLKETLDKPSVKKEKGTIVLSYQPYNYFVVLGIELRALHMLDKLISWYSLGF